MKGIRGLLVLLALALAGCKQSEPVASESASLSLFKLGKGIVFSEETKMLLGIEVAEVTERPMQRRVEKSAQVYRVGAGDRRSSALLLLEPDEAVALTIGKL